MNKEQLFLEIDEIYSEWHGGNLHIGKERTERIKELLDKAINNRCCCKSDSELLCECAMPDPIDPFASVDKDTCRKCNNLIA